MTIIQRSIVAFCLACLTAVESSAAPGRVALVIANDAYAEPFATLSVTKPARSLADSLQALEFKLIRGGLLSNLSGSAMQAAIDDFVSAAASADVALLYYGGHGSEYAGENYLIPVDYGSGGQGNLGVDAVRLSGILERIGKAGPKAVVVIMDACRQNSLGGALASPAMLPLNTFLAYSTAPNRTAKDPSPYTAALSKWIAEPGMTLNDVFVQVRTQVIRETSGAQVPEEFTTWNSQSPPVLREARWITGAITSADDSVDVSINGASPALHLSAGDAARRTGRLLLKPGPNRIEIVVFNQRTFTGGIAGFGGHLPEGWNYGLVLTDKTGAVLANINDREDRPQQDGPRHGHSFLAASVDINYDAKTDSIKVERVTKVKR
jgi:hypothetical protein